MFWDLFGSVRSLFWYRLGRSVSKVARDLEGAPEKFLALGNGRFGRAAQPSDVSRFHWDRGKEAWKVRRIYSEKGTRKFRAKATVQVWSRYVLVFLPSLPVPPSSPPFLRRQGRASGVEDLQQRYRQARGFEELDCRGARWAVFRLIWNVFGFVQKRSFAVLVPSGAECLEGRARP